MRGKIDCKELAFGLVLRHAECCRFDHYAGIVTLHGLVRLAEATGDDAIRAKAVELLTPFFTGRVEKVGGAYDKMYRCGGNASVWLAKCGYVSGILPMLVAKAEELIATHPRDDRGVFGHLSDRRKIWIDSVFAVCPFLAVLGNLTGRKDFLAEAAKQMTETHHALFDRETGLYRQSLFFAGENKLSEDNWSRGNGWGALALADLAAELPDDFESTPAIRTMFADFVAAAIKLQDEDGLWHQEMTRPDSYVETSGTGLILYAIGRGLEAGVIDAKYRENFLRGLRGYLGYIAQDHSVFNCCVGCLCPKQGTVEDYMNHPWKRDDIHAFGPAVLAFGQAIRLGITSIEY